MTGRSVGRLWRCTNCVLENSSQNLRQRRTFASSAAFQKYGAVPSFTETSSPELDSLLSSFRNNVFLPSHLSKEHQLLVYRTKHMKLLQDDPVTVNIAGETFRLKHINRTGDLPSHTKGLFQATALMKKRQDWNNIVPLLAGYKNSPHKMTPEMKTRLVRKVGKAGRMSVLLESARRVDYTGFALDSPNIVTDMAWYIQNKAAMMRWTLAETANALSKVEEIAALLEDKRHSGGFEIADQDPRVRPELIGILLQLSAVLAVKHQGGKDEDGKVKIYTKRLRGVIESGQQILLTGNTAKWGEDHCFLYRIAPVVHGMKLAQKVLEPGSSLAYWLEAQTKVFADAAEMTHASLYEKTESKNRLRSIDCYRKLLGRHSRL